MTGLPSSNMPTELTGTCTRLPQFEFILDGAFRVAAASARRAAPQSTRGRCFRDIPEAAALGRKGIAVHNGAARCRSLGQAASKNLVPVRHPPKAQSNCTGIPLRQVKLPDRTRDRYGWRNPARNRRRIGYFQAQSRRIPLAWTLKSGDGLMMRTAQITEFRKSQFTRINMTALAARIRAGNESRNGLNRK